MTGVTEKSFMCQLFMSLYYVPFPAPKSAEPARTDVGERVGQEKVNSVQTRCTVKGKAQKSPLAPAIFWKFLIF